MTRLDRAREKFEHDLAETIVEVNGMSYEEARKMLAESEGRKRWVEMQAEYEANRSFINRLFDRLEEWIWPS